MAKIVTLYQLTQTDDLAAVKGVRWLREQIKSGRLKSYDTGNKRRSYYVDLDEWARFKDTQLKTVPAE